MHNLDLKTSAEIEIMKEGGNLLSAIKLELQENVKPGVSAYAIEKLANELIAKTGGAASFKMVEGYSWATCISVNEQVVHGIPKKTTIFQDNDVVSVDVGLFYKGFHTDTSFSVGIKPSREVKDFLTAGEKAVSAAIKKCIPGNFVFDLSYAMEKKITGAGYHPVHALVGHGVGRNLHEEPQVPCISYGVREESVRLVAGLVLAIEVMYGLGTGEVYKEDDGWTISVRDGKISGLFEETVAVTADGPFVLT